MMLTGNLIAGTAVSKSGVRCTDFIYQPAVEGRHDISMMILPPYGYPVFPGAGSNGKHSLYIVQNLPAHQVIGFLCHPCRGVRAQYILSVLHLLVDIADASSGI